MEFITNLQKWDVVSTVINRRIHGCKERVIIDNHKLTTNPEHSEAITANIERLNNQISVLHEAKQDIKRLFRIRDNTDFVDFTAIAEANPQPGEPHYPIFAFMVEQFGIYMTTKEIEYLLTIIVES
jgi:hypothetical protein